MDSKKRFKKNIDLLEKIIPDIALKLPYVDTSHHEFCQARDGTQNLKITVDGKEEFYHSSYSPQKEAVKWFQSLILENVQVLGVYGVGLGYVFDAVKEWLEQDVNRYLVFIEDDPCVLKKLLETEKGTEIIDHKQVQLHYLAPSKAGGAMIDWLTWFFIRLNWEVSALPFYERKYEELYFRIKGQILHISVNKNSMAKEYVRYGDAFYYNYYTNILRLDHCCHGNKLFGKFQGVPAIICGAGPSLAKQIPLLKKLKNRALIFAGGSSLNALSAEGVLPHFGGGIDPNPTQLDRLLSNSGFQVPFFYRGRMFHEAFDAIHGDRLYLNGAGGYDVSNWFEEELNITGPQIDEGCNVVNMSVDIARHLGCSTIIFVGMDLAYTGLQLYSPGVIANQNVKEEEIVQNKDINTSAFMRQDIYGKDLYTLWKWVSEAEWIGDYARRHPEIQCFNATEGGLGFPGVQNITLKKAAEKYMLEEFPLEDQVHTEIQNSRFVEFSSIKLIELIETMHESLEKCQNSIHEIMEELNQVERKIKKRQDLLPDLATPLLALHESELEEEVAYKYVLKNLSIVNNRILDRKYYLIRYDKSLQTDREKDLKRITIKREKYHFLKEACLVNQKALLFAVKKHQKQGGEPSEYFQNIQNNNKEVNV